MQRDHRRPIDRELRWYSPEAVLDADDPEERRDAGLETRDARYACVALRSIGAELLDLTELRITS